MKAAAILWRRLALTLGLSAGLVSVPVQASNDGQLCSGLGLPVCASIMLIQALTPPTAKEHLDKALRAGDLAQVRLLLRWAPGLPPPADRLGAAALSYVQRASATDLEGDRYRIVEAMLEGADIAGDAGSQFLQIAVIDSDQRRDDTPRPQRLRLAQLLIQHGARAGEVRLENCRGCEVDDGFLPLLLAHGAQPDRPSDAYPGLLEQFLTHQQFDAAERLVRSGASPNGAPLRRRSMLARIAGTCNLRRPPASPRDVTNAQWCTGRALQQLRFAVTQLGADPNGPALPETDCITPYESARDMGNLPVAQALLDLGASANAGERCRVSAPH